MILNLLPQRRIEIGVEASDWQEVVEKGGRFLLDDGVIEKRYITAMKDSIIENGPYVVVGEGIALLHARPEDGVNEIGMSLITLKNPVNFGNPEKDPVKIAFSFSAIDNSSHTQAISQLSQILLEEENSVEKIYSFNTSQKIREYIKKVVNKVKKEGGD